MVALPPSLAETNKKTKAALNTTATDLLMRLMEFLLLSQ
jgi:hypothetical protein